ncbi:MAG: monooxygenase [Thermodesulfobacteriota bacterium]
MPKLLQIDFPFPGPFGDKMAEALRELALSINEEPGFIWKIWTEDQEQNMAGGIYLFETEEDARAYLDKHRARLKEFGVSHINALIFDINPALSYLNHAPL